MIAPCTFAGPLQVFGDHLLVKKGRSKLESEAIFVESSLDFSMLADREGV
jgi:hypothetical protein